MISHIQIYIYIYIYLFIYLKHRERSWIGHILRMDKERSVKRQYSGDQLQQERLADRGKDGSYSRGSG